MKKFAFAAALLSCVAAHAVGPGVAAFAGAMQGQKIEECRQSCRPGDGQCYQGCAAMYATPQQPQQSYQQEPMRRTDYQCLNQCTQAGYMYQYCQSKCSY